MEERVSIEWGWRRRSKGSQVRKVPGAFSAADVYQHLQEINMIHPGLGYHIVSRKMTDWSLQENFKVPTSP